MHAFSHRHRQHKPKTPPSSTMLASSSAAAAAAAFVRRTLTSPVLVSRRGLAIAVGGKVPAAIPLKEVREEVDG